MKQKTLIQIIISLLALFIGYPFGGSVFIIAMAPLVLYLVLSEKGDYLPAIMIHCASGTSIMYLVFFAIIFVCIKSYKEKISKDGFLRLCFWLLAICSPLFFLLVYQRITLDGDDLRGALGYTAYYLSFWGFIYCYIITKSISFTPKLLVFITFFLLMMTFIPGIRHGAYTRLAFSSLYAIQAVSVYGFLRSKRPKWILLYIISFILMSANNHVLTFTEFGATILTTLLVFASVKHRNKLLKILSGPVVYVVFFSLIAYGSITYETQSITQMENGVDFSSVDSFVERFRFKLFSDRAPYWSASLKQLGVYRPLFPIHNIPNIDVMSVEGVNIGEVEFGAHCTPLQLLRIFGFIMGGVLCLLYMAMTIKASNYLTELSKYKTLWLPYFCASLSSTLMYFLTGTSAMLCYYSLYTFGILGIAYSKFKTIPK